MRSNLRLTYWRWRYGARRTGKTTRLLVRRVPLDATGWKAIGMLVALVFGLLAWQVYAAYASRPRYVPLEAQPLSVTRDPIVIFQTVQPLPTPQPEIRYIDRPVEVPVYIEVPVLAPAVVQPVAPPPAPAPQAEPSGGNEAPAGCDFPIVNGVCGGGEPVPPEDTKGARVNARSYK